MRLMENKLRDFYCRIREAELCDTGMFIISFCEFHFIFK